MPEAISVDHIRYERGIAGNATWPRLGLSHYAEFNHVSVKTGDAWRIDIPFDQWPALKDFIDQSYERWKAQGGN